MSFTSLQFIAFLLVTVLVYYIAPRKVQWWVLLIASYVFYLWNGITVGFYILFTTATSFAGGILLGKIGKTRDKKLKTRKKLILSTVLVLNFGLLYIVKYWDFTAQFLKLPTLSLIMPLGISFYIFQSAGYVIDCYRGKYTPQKNFFRFALFTSFFPQLIQGPISRYDDLAPQLFSGRKFNADNAKYGIQLILWGYFKKLVVADRAAVLVNTVFGNSDGYSGTVIALSVLFYCIQLYCDFSGGIDITRGIAQMLGIDMAQNFRRPIFADSLTEYWRRWHITLGAWMKDYLFYPMSLSKPFSKLGKFTRRKIGGKLGKIIPTSLATFIIYFVIGIWHGANFRYIAFGIYNGVIITSSLLLANFFFTVKTKLHINDKTVFYRVFCMLRTGFIVFIGRYITRAPRLTAAVRMVIKTFTDIKLTELFDGTVLSLGLKSWDIITVALGVAVILCIEFLQETGVHIRKSLEKKSFFIQWLAMFILIAVILLFGIFRDGYIASEFIYKQF